MNFNDVRGRFHVCAEFEKIAFKVLTAFFHLRCFHVDDDVYLEMLKRKFTKSIFFGESLARFFTVLALDSLMTARKMIAVGFQVCQEEVKTPSKCTHYRTATNIKLKV